ncbi:FAD binding domain-containing protein [Thermoproteota archaeon]
MRPMKTFKHYDATTIEETISILKEYQDKAKICAGGTALLDTMKRRILPTPEVVVNIKNIPGLNEIKEDEEGLKIGPLVTLSEIEKSGTIKSKYEVLSEAVASSATPAIRNMATAAGSICQHVRCWYYLKSDFFCFRKGGPICFAATGDNRYHSIMEQAVCVAASPSDLTTALVALNAKLTIQGPEGTREVELKDFYVTLGNLLKPDEIIISIVVPQAPSKSTFKRAAIRKAIDFALSSVAAASTDKGTTVALGGVAPVPISGTPDEITAALDKATPLSDNKYKVPMTKALLRDALAAV